MLCTFTQHQIHILLRNCTILKKKGIRAPTEDLKSIVWMAHIPENKLLNLSQIPTHYTPNPGQYDRYFFSPAQPQSYPQPAPCYPPLSLALGLHTKQLYLSVGLQQPYFTQGYIPLQNTQPYHPYLPSQLQPPQTQGRNQGRQ